MIKFEKVTKTYARAHTHALRDINFQIQEGEFVYLTGHSGAGKSTLLATLLRRVRPSEGRVEVFGSNIANIPKGRIWSYRRRIGMVFQDHRLLNNMSVLDNLVFTLRAVGSNKDIEKRALSMLREVNLAHKRKAYPVELSLGEQQRVAIARALINQPELLLCDEPTGNLDPDTSWDILELLDEVNLKGTTVLVATHARDLVDKMRRRTLVLRNGMLVRDDARGGYSL